MILVLVTGVVLPAAAHAHAHAAAAAASAYDASKSAYYQQAAAAYPAAAPPQPQPTYDATAAKPAYSTPATYAQVSCQLMSCECCDNYFTTRETFCSAV